MKVFLMMAGIVLIAGAAWAMGDIYVSGKWRYKITVEVETPEGIKTGSAVHELSNADSSIKILDFPEAGNPATLKGEAVVVDLGKRGVLFALLPDEHLFYSAFPLPGGPGGETTPKGIRYYKSLKNAKVVLEPGPLPNPDLVTFEDIKNPKTVKRVDSSDLATAFGNGVRLKNITIETTEEPITWVIEKYLPWLKKLNGSYLNGQHINGPELYDQLHVGNFQMGEKK